jgi:stage V sporulation protein S
MSADDKLDMSLGDIITDDNGGGNDDGDAAAASGDKKGKGKAYSKNLGGGNENRDEQRNHPYKRTNTNVNSFIGHSVASVAGVESRMLKVSARSDPKKVAGSIAHTCRQGEAPTIVGTGSHSVNQGIKAIAIARGFLEEEKIDVTCDPETRNRERCAVSLILRKSAAAPKNQQNTAVADATELRVSANSEAGPVAGAIANTVREGQRVVLLGIGPESVSICVLALSTARKYLADDGIDISFRPEFIHVEMGEESRSVMKFVVLAQQII